MSATAQSLEEAANIASEFVYSVDNLPAEVAHLLQEIKFKEVRAQELQQEIDKDAARYVRHSLRPNSPSTSTPSSSTPTAPRAPSPKSSIIPAKIASSYAEIRTLSAEKCALAQRLIDLVTRTRARLDADLSKVRILQGEEAIDYGAQPHFSGRGATLGASASVNGFALGASTGVVGGEPYGSSVSALGGRSAAVQMGDNLRSALIGGVGGIGGSISGLGGIGDTKVGGAGSVASTPTYGHKRRRLGTSASIKLTPAAGSPTKHRSASPAAMGAIGSATTHQRSRLSRQIHPPAAAVEEPDVDGEGDEDADGDEGDGDDEKLYCICQKQSYGDMIACDNEGGCQFEWFHLSCVGLKQPTPEKWYCPDCKAKGAGTTVGRKGRKNKG